MYIVVTSLIFLNKKKIIHGESLDEATPDEVILDTDTLNVLMEDNKWSPFKRRGLHLIHLDINSLFPKIEELCEIAKLSSMAVMGILESKLDDSVLGKVNIGYDVVRTDKNRHGCGDTCYIRSTYKFQCKELLSG